MDEDLSVINSRTRNEKIKNFILNNKNKIILGLILIILIIVGIFSYEKYEEKKNREISDKYNSLIIAYSEKNSEMIANGLIEIINENDPTYAPLSLYFIIDNNLVKNQAKVNKLFNIIIEDISLDDEIKNLIIYKKALFNADNFQEGELLSILNPLINSNSVWKSHALYLMAEYFYVNNQKQKAKEFFNQIISLENSNMDIRLQTEKRLNRDLSE